MKNLSFKNQIIKNCYTGLLNLHIKNNKIDNEIISIEHLSCNSEEEFQEIKNKIDKLKNYW